MGKTYCVAVHTLRMPTYRTATGLTLESARQSLQDWVRGWRMASNYRGQYRATVERRDCAGNVTRMYLYRGRKVVGRIFVETDNMFNAVYGSK